MADGYDDELIPEDTGGAPTGSPAGLPEDSGVQEAVANAPQDEGSQQGYLDWVREIVNNAREQFGIGAPEALPMGMAEGDEPTGSPAGLPEGDVGSGGEEPTGSPAGLPEGDLSEPDTGAIQDQSRRLTAAGVPDMSGGDAGPGIDVEKGVQQRHEAITGAAEQNAAQYMRYLMGEKAEDPQVREQREAQIRANNPDMNMSEARLESLRQAANMGTEQGVAALQGNRAIHQSLRGKAAAALDFGKNPEAAAKLFNEAHTFVPDGQHVVAVPDNKGITLVFPQPEGGTAETVPLTPDQFRELLHGPVGEFDHLTERGLKVNAGDLAKTPGMLEPAPSQLGGTPAGAPAAPAGAAAAAPDAPQGRGAAARWAQPPAAQQQGNGAAARWANTPQQGGDTSRMREGPAGGRSTSGFGRGQSPGDVITGGKGPYDRSGLSQSQKAARGDYDVGRPDKSYAATKYGRDVRDPDGWPTGIPRGGQFTRDGRYYDARGHTYDVDRHGLPLAQQGQPGWHGPTRGQPRWNGSQDGSFQPQQPTFRPQVISPRGVQTEQKIENKPMTPLERERLSISREKLESSKDLGSRRLSVSEQEHERKLQQGGQRIEQGAQRLDQGGRRLDQGDRRLDQGDRRTDVQERHYSQQDAARAADRAARMDANAINNATRSLDTRINNSGYNSLSPEEKAMHDALRQRAQDAIQRSAAPPAARPSAPPPAAAAPSSAPPPGAQGPGEWRVNTRTGERRWFPAQ